MDGIYLNQSPIVIVWLSYSIQLNHLAWRILLKVCFDVSS
jgi:hypothetical protein